MLNLHGFLSILSLIFILVFPESALFCTIVDGYITPGQYTLERQVSTGFCAEWIAGPIVSPKLVLISFPKVNLDCKSGDNLIAYTDDRTKVLFNYCQPIPNQNLYVVTEGKYAILSLITTSSRLLSVTIQYYVAEISSTTTTPATVAAAELSTFPTLSTQSSTAVGGTVVTFGTLSTASSASVTSTTTLGTAAQITTGTTSSTRFPTLSSSALGNVTEAQQQILTTTTTPANIATSLSCPSSSVPQLFTSTNSTVGIIQSPNFPYRYPNNARCYWMIEAKADERIYLEFDIINLPSYMSGVFYSNCPSDYLEIFDFNRPTDSYKLCGDRRSFKLIVPYRKVVLYFYSNGVTEAQFGFRFLFRIEKTTTTTAAATTTTTKIAATTTTTTKIAATTTTTKIAAATTTTVPNISIITITQAPTVTTTRITTTTTTTLATFANADSCGVAFYKANDVLLRIIGGTESVPHSWPWQVLITDDSTFICGGSLINNNWVVTAAHCMDGRSPSSLKVYLGMHDRVNKEASTVTRTIARIIISPDYVGSVNQWDADIALVKLSQPVAYTNEIRPVCLPSQGNNLAVLGKTGMVTGWGRTKGFGSDQVLMQTTITVDNNVACEANSNNMICAGQTGIFSHGTCEGDSGGPFVVLQNNVYYLAGIVSWGRGDCSPPSVYTKVSNFVGWINSVVTTN